MVCILIVATGIAIQVMFANFVHLRAIHVSLMTIVVPVIVQLLALCSARKIAATTVGVIKSTLL